jgi:NADH dehydrogenase
MKVIIVGGGAGGLELATKLGNSLGKKGQAEIVLYDRNPTHIWKPLLHEVASGSLDADLDGVSYRAHAHQHGFRFKLGSLCAVDVANQAITLAQQLDDEGTEILPERSDRYDYLVLAIGGMSNDFGVSGVREHCIFLDSPAQAQRFHQRLVGRFIRLNRDLTAGMAERKLRVAIVGGGATGVELSAELYKAREWFSVYGLDAVKTEHLDVTLVEAGPCLLPALSERIATATAQELTRLGVKVRTATAVVAATEQGLVTGDDELIAADLMVWAAGVKAPDFLANIGGLETNRANQIVVDDMLRAKGSEQIFAIGDCAGFAMGEVEGRTLWVPPRAQSAHQMAATVANNLIAIAKQKPLQKFHYKDHGSLVSLSQYTAFGRLMGGLARGGLSVEGRVARLAYVSLYRMHQVALHGWWRAALVALNDKINHFVRPRFKVH